MAGAGGLAACGARVNRSEAKRGLLDVGRLTEAFPALAVRAAPGRLNLAVLSLAGDQVWAADSDRRFPLAGVAFLPLAAAALGEVDAGRLQLGEPIAIRDVDLSPPPSAINAAFRAPLTLPAIDLIALAVQRGDNSAADVIMGRIGGPGAVGGWLQAKAVEGLRIDRYAREIGVDRLGLASFRSDWRTPEAFNAAIAQVPAATREAAAQAYLSDPRDTITAPAALGFLDKLADGRLLSPASTRLLLRLMSGRAAGQGGLAAALPSSATVAEMTGDSGTDLGFTPATNAIAVISLEGRQKLAIAAFLAGSTATLAERRRLIADCGRLAFDAFG